jgi:hypothetical protein
MLKHSYYTIDWPDFKVWLGRSMEGEIPSVSRSANRTVIRDALTGGQWYGYTEREAKDWLRNGYRTSALDGIADSVAPIRERRKFLFQEEGDEYYHDRMLDGDDLFFSEMTPQERIPGVALEISLVFSSFTNANIITEYLGWVCQTIYSLEVSGVDSEITLDFPTVGLNRNQMDTVYHNIVRVKAENEVTSFSSFSPMISPAAFRGFGFSLMGLHADRDKFNCNPTLGRGMQHIKEWSVSYDSDRRVILFQNHYHGATNFPRELMTSQFQTALDQMRGKLASE